MKICMESRTYLNPVLKTQGWAVIIKKQKQKKPYDPGSEKHEE